MLGGGTRIAGGWSLGGVSLTNGNIRARGYSGGGGISSSLYETVLKTPSIVMQPVSRTNNAGTTATFNVGVIGAAPFGYQWFKGNTALTDGGNVSGSATATLTLNNVSGADAANYSVVITNAYGSVTSSVAVLTFYQPPVANPASYTRNAGLTLKIDISELLADFTSDPDGNAVTFMGFGAPAHGSLTQIGNWLLYTPNLNDDTNDAFSYSITDGFGGYATNTISVTVITPGGVVKAAQPTGGSITLTLAGIPSVTYDIQRSTDLSNWTVVGTVTAPAHGVFSFTDANPPQPSAYYRMKQH